MRFELRLSNYLLQSKHVSCTKRILTSSRLHLFIIFLAHAVFANRLIEFFCTNKHVFHHVTFYRLAD
jgi:hypothetical protein